MKEELSTAGPFSEAKEPKELAEILNLLYHPAETACEADDLLDGTEIMEAITPYCETSREFLFKTLVEQGFRTTTIENTLYWLIHYNQ